MIDVKARVCFNCHVYTMINPASSRSQAAINKFNKDHPLHMVQTVTYDEVKAGYKSKTREYLR